MANTIYVPVGGLSDEVEKFYASVGGLSKEVIKGYCSVGGLSKQFYGSGGSSLIFEYDYQDNTTYEIHNYLTIDYILEACYNEFIDCFGSYSTQYNQIQYLINHWQTIKTAIINKLGSQSYSVQNIRVYIFFNTADPNNDVMIDVYYGNDTFPKRVKTKQTGCRATDNWGNVYYTLGTSTPVPPQQKKHFITYVFPSSYTIDDTPSSSSGYMTTIGLYSTQTTTSSSTQCTTQMTNFGMKVV